MSKREIISLFWTFIRIFLLLLITAVIMPIILDQAVNLINKGISPGKDSIIVFRGVYISEHKVFIRFIKAIKTIIKYI